MSEEEEPEGYYDDDDNNSQRSRIQKRGTLVRRYSNVVIHDKLPKHTARELCEDRGASGPNFVNPDEGLFCEITTRTLYPVCNNDDDTTSTIPKRTVAVGNIRGDLGCYDLQNSQLGELPYNYTPFRPC